MRPLYALLACSACLLYRTVSAQQSSIAIGADQQDNGVVNVPDPTPVDSPPAPTPADQDAQPPSNEDGDTDLPIADPPDGPPSPDDSNDNSPDDSTDNSPDENTPDDNGQAPPADGPSGKNAPTPTYRAIKDGPSVSALVNDQWVPIQPAMLEFDPVAQAVYTGVKVVGNSTTMIVPPTATAVTVDGNVFHVAHTNAPIPSDLLHTDTPSPSVSAPASLSGSDIVFPTAANATRGQLVGALLLDPDSQRLHREKGDAAWWREMACIMGALACLFGLGLLLSLLSICCRGRRRKTVQRTSTSKDPATGLMVTTTETKQQGTLNRQAEEGRGRLSQLIGTGNKGDAAGAGTAAAMGAAAGSEAGSHEGNAGSSGGSGAAGGSGASGAAGGASGGSAMGGGSGAGSSGATGGGAVSGGGTKVVSDGPGHVEHVEAVPAHDGADSLRTGSEMADMGSLRGRKMMRGDNRSPF